MPKFAIYAGLGGGFGGASYQEVYEGSKKDAEDLAYDRAVEIYESYEGLHGIRDVEQIMEEDGLKEDEAQEVYDYEKESWLDYKAVEIPEDIEETESVIDEYVSSLDE